MSSNNKASCYSLYYTVTIFKKSDNRQSTLSTLILVVDEVANDEVISSAVTNPFLHSIVDAIKSGVTVALRAHLRKIRETHRIVEAFFIRGFTKIQDSGSFRAQIS